MAFFVRRTDTEVPDRVGHHLHVDRPKKKTLTPRLHPSSRTTSCEAWTIWTRRTGGQVLRERSTTRKSSCSVTMKNLTRRESPLSLFQASDYSYVRSNPVRPLKVKRKRKRKQNERGKLIAKWMERMNKIEASGPNLSDSQAATRATRQPPLNREAAGPNPKHRTVISTHQWTYVNIYPQQHRSII